MKLNKIFPFIGLAVLAASFTGCTDDVDYTPAQPVNTPGVYFSDEEETEFAINAQAVAQPVTIYRAASDEAIKVTLNVTGDNEFFTVDNEVSFAAGQTSATFNVTPLVSKMEDFTTYHITVSIPEEMTSPYIIGSWDGFFTYANMKEWITLGECDFTDDIIASLFNNSGPFTWPVVIEEHSQTPGLFRLVNPYGCEASPFADAAVSAESYLVINATDPSQVYFGYNPGAAYSINVNLGYGLMGVGILSFGTYADGMITFPVKGLVAIDDDGQYYANSNGAFCIDLTVLE